LWNSTDYVFTSPSSPEQNPNPPPFMCHLLLSSEPLSLKFQSLAIISLHSLLGIQIADNVELNYWQGESKINIFTNYEESWKLLTNQTVGWRSPQRRCHMTVHHLWLLKVRRNIVEFWKSYVTKRESEERKDNLKAKTVVI